MSKSVEVECNRDVPIEFTPIAILDDNRTRRLGSISATKIANSANTVNVSNIQ